MKGLQTIMLMSLTLLLAACANVNKSGSLHPLQKNRVCEEIRQKIIMNTVNNVPDQQGYSPTQRAYLYQQYQKNNCPQKLGEQ